MAKKGLFGVDWGALGKFALGVGTGDANMAVDALRDTEPPPSPEDTAPHAPNSPACTRRDGGFHCIGHTDEGACVMARDE